MNFFWEKNSRSKGKSRFNLLLLEYGEYYFEDFSVFLFPVTEDGDFLSADRLKIQGRLKLCSKSILFEPIEARRPILKFPFKLMVKESLRRFMFRDAAAARSRSEFSGFFAFRCSSYLDMKGNDKVGPYRQIDASSPAIASELYVSSDSTIQVLFALVHSDIDKVQAKIENMKHIFDVMDREGRGAGEQLLSPILESSTISTFETSHLVNFHENLKLSAPVPVKKVKPLILNPGSLMITDQRVYFQPSNLNNVGEVIQHMEMRKIVRVYCRRYLLRQTG